MPPASSSAVAEQVWNYFRDGFLIVRNVFDGDEIAALAAEADALAARTELIDTNNIRCRWQNNAAGECTFDCFDPVIDIGPVEPVFRLRSSNPRCSPGDLRGRCPPLQGQVDLQASWRIRLRAPSRFHQLAGFPRELHHRGRGH